MEDIATTIPRACGDSNCSTGWHLEHYWVYDDGTYSVCDTDGNHEDCDRLPTAEEEIVAWLAYYDYVANAGLDPLKEFVVPKGARTPRVWQVRVREWIGSATHGLMVTGARRRGVGAWKPVREVPIEVCRYMLLNGRDCIEGYTSLDTLIQECDEKTVKRKNQLEAWITVTVEEEPKPWTEERRTKYLRKVAKEAAGEQKNRYLHRLTSTTGSV